MVNNNLGVYFAKIMGELVIDILYFPLWWYSRGFLLILNKLYKFLSERQKGLALFVWMKNIFKPMYGQTDWEGRLVSIFIRLVQIFFRGLVMFFWLIVVIIAISIWVGLPILVVFEVFFQLVPTDIMNKIH